MFQSVSLTKFKTFLLKVETLFLFPNMISIAKHSSTEIWSKVVLCHFSSSNITCVAVATKHKLV